MAKTEDDLAVTAVSLGFRHQPLPSDVGDVRRLVTQTGFFSRAEIQIAEELVGERLAKGAAESGYEFVFATVGEAIVGYACYGPIACTVGSFDLYWLAVDQGRQRQGLGRQIVAEAERQILAAHGRHIYVETSGRDQYEPTRRFYSQVGYEQVAVFTDFYAPGDDKVVYRKVLRP
jgi:ribosomal protein S18 acetylase RimI-like enzyme